MDWPFDENYCQKTNYAKNQDDIKYAKENMAADATSVISGRLSENEMDISSPIERVASENSVRNVERDNCKMFSDVSSEATLEVNKVISDTVDSILQDVIPKASNNRGTKKLKEVFHPFPATVKQCTKWNVDQHYTIKVLPSQDSADIESTDDIAENIATSSYAENKELVAGKCKEMKECDVSTSSPLREKSRKIHRHSGKACNSPEKHQQRKKTNNGKTHHIPQANKQVQNTTNRPLYGSPKRKAVSSSTKSRGVKATDKAHPSVPSKKQGKAQVAQSKHVKVDSTSKQKGSIANRQFNSKPSRSAKPAMGSPKKSQNLHLSPKSKHPLSAAIATKTIKETKPRSLKTNRDMRGQQSLEKKSEPLVPKMSMERPNQKSYQTDVKSEPSPRENARHNQLIIEFGEDETESYDFNSPTQEQKNRLVVPKENDRSPVRTMEVLPAEKSESLIHLMAISLSQTSVSSLGTSGSNTPVKEPGKSYSSVKIARSEESLERKTIVLGVLLKQVFQFKIVEALD